MAWTDANGVMLRVEEFIKDLYKNLSLEIVCPIPASDFPRITYDEAMSKHGSDKPDIRIHDLVSAGHRFFFWPARANAFRFIASTILFHKILRGCLPISKIP